MKWEILGDIFRNVFLNPSLRFIPGGQNLLDSLSLTDSVSAWVLAIHRWYIQFGDLEEHLIKRLFTKDWTRCKNRAREHGTLDLVKVWGTLPPQDPKGERGQCSPQPELLCGKGLGSGGWGRQRPAVTHRELPQGINS